MFNLFENAIEPTTKKLEAMVGEVQNNIRTKRVTKYGPMNDTGQAANSIVSRIELPDDSSIVTKIVSIGPASKYIMTLESGRGPSKRRNAGSIFKPIYQWVIRRNIFPDKGSQKGLAWAIASKITNEGTMLYRMGGNSGNISDVINDSIKYEIKSTLINQGRNVLNKLLLQSLKTAKI